MRSRRSDQIPITPQPSSLALHPRVRSWEASGRRPVTARRSFAAGVRNPSPRTLHPSGHRKGRLLMSASKERARHRRRRGPRGVGERRGHADPAPVRDRELPLVALGRGGERSHVAEHRRARRGHAQLAASPRQPPPLACGCLHRRSMPAPTIAGQPRRIMIQPQRLSRNRHGGVESRQFHGI